jgi:hypothetical protein
MLAPPALRTATRNSALPIAVESSANHHVRVVSLRVWAACQSMPMDSNRAIA